MRRQVQDRLGASIWMPEILVCASDLEGVSDRGLAGWSAHLLPKPVWQKRSGIDKWLDALHLVGQ